MPLPDIESYPTQPFYVKYVGYEIEGGFSNISQDCECDTEENGCDCNGYDNTYFKEDNSVIVNHYTEGEIASARFRFDRLDNMDDFSKQNFPDKVNDTCGHHVHVSFNNDLAYSRTMDKSFIISFKKAVMQFYTFEPILYDDKELYSRFLRRLKGREYCHDFFSPNAQANINWHSFDGNDQGRYTMINYAYSKFNTIECRVFPAENTYEQLIKVNHFFIDFTNNFLSNCKKERANFNRININDSEKNIEETLTLCV